MRYVKLYHVNQFEFWVWMTHFRLIEHPIDAMRRLIDWGHLFLFNSIPFILAPNHGSTRSGQLFHK